MCSRSRHNRAPLAASHIDLLWPWSTARDQECLIFPKGGKPESLETAENHYTTKLTYMYGPGRASNQGHLGERQALKAQANYAPMNGQHIPRAANICNQGDFAQQSCWISDFLEVRPFTSVEYGPRLESHLRPKPSMWIWLIHFKMLFLV